MGDSEEIKDYGLNSINHFYLRRERNIYQRNVLDLIVDRVALWADSVLRWKVAELINLSDLMKISKSQGNSVLYREAMSQAMRKLPLLL